jgi:hypothetical protein
VRERKSLRVSPAPDDRESARRLLKNVDEAEVLLLRNDRSMILTDVRNRKRKEEQERAKELEARRLRRGSDR